MSHKATPGNGRPTDAPTIPQIIHQVWKDEEIPEVWRDFVGSWKRVHPEWEYRLWTDRSARRLVSERYPELLPLYDGFAYDIQRADLARYLILHCCGGVYADLDMECVQPLSGLLAGRSFVACCEPAKHARTKDVEKIVCNAFLASVPGHPLLAKVIETIAASAAPAGATTLHVDVLTSTGPLMLTRIVDEHGTRDSAILGEEVACPLASDALRLEELLKRESSAQAVKEELIRNGTYAIHYWSNSWVRNLAGTLRNPEPHKIEGYEFYPGWDSCGNDIRNGGRDIEMLARECDRMGKAVAFNTDGFIKDRLRSCFLWTRIRSAHGNEGLYVKNTRLSPLKRQVVRRVLKAALRIKRLLYVSGFRQ